MANSKRKCRYCKTYAPVAQGKLVPLGFFCSVDCAAEYGRQGAKKAAQKQFKSELKQYREKNKSVSDWKREAQAAFNAYIRYRDRNLGCVSCGSRGDIVFGGNIDAGHYRSRGSAGHLAFHQHNCHAQCVRCNRYLSGNIVEYRQGLVERIGLDKVEALENNNEIRKFDVDYLRRVKHIFLKKKRIKEKLSKK